MKVQQRIKFRGKFISKMCKKYYSGQIRSIFRVKKLNLDQIRVFVADKIELAPQSNDCMRQFCLNDDIFSFYL
ncbi:hypothetical protein MAH1_14320 [Sessilibacter sp. MAH1]